MTRKIANSTCDVCHLITPRTEMRKVEQSSTRFAGVSVSPASKKGLSPRMYFRKTRRTSWVCNDCHQQQVRKNKENFIGLVLIVGLIAFIALVVSFMG